MIQLTVESALPRWLKHLRNKISENLPKHEAEQFAKDFLAAFPVGADIEQVLPIVTIARLERCKVGSERWGDAYREQVLAAIDGVIDLYRDSGYLAAKSEAESTAQSAARLASDLALNAAYSANSAANSAANWAADWAYWAARSAYSAADFGAHAAEEAAADWAAHSATYFGAHAAEEAAAADWAAHSARLEAWRIERDVLLDALRQCKESL